MTTDGWEELIVSILRQICGMTQGDLMLTLGIVADGRKANGKDGQAYMRDIKSDRNAVNAAIRRLRSKRIISISKGGIITLKEGR